MLVRLSWEERENSGDQKGNTLVAQGQCTQRVQICENLISFSNSGGVFVIFLTDSFTVSFMTNLVQVNCLYAANYIRIVR